MRSLYLYQENVEEVKGEFNQAIKHHYLQTYVPDIEVDDDKIRFMYAMLHNKMTKEDLHLLILSTLLVQAGLDIHDEVTLKNVDTDELKKKRQLTVLAGDYYVAMYYHLLAKNGNVPLIQKISHTIQQINEKKMNHYEQEEISIEEYKKIVEIIETGLMQQVASHFDLELWRLLIKEFFYFKMLTNEKNLLINGEQTALLRGLHKTKPLIHRDSFLDNKIEESKDRMLQLVESSATIKPFIIWHIDQYICYDTLENIAEGE
ncbi:heptaprenyl diphosphate synthase component 1 [Alkalihalobacillus hemicellulosilyticus]|uniref:Heptaprenyl diphosphate synthase component I n=1 Tax=Halalkalibacter hemicellulosilyticusJCM 9152 TaxID=1236971 RepID=W4QCC2_9BACI|nr:heptaprenyl diphosphate synthase component 1 [Halalkalibacter hemicellulosilyticus]GAE29009.1 heptaprenyl diphosphate synthase component I [Halalkalibacter hemicellulosilyticusJCM 9152]